MTQVSSIVRNRKKISDLTPEEIVEIYVNTESLSAKELSKKYHTPTTTVYNIWASRVGIKITRNYRRPAGENKRRNTGEAHHNSVLADRDVEAIRESHNSAKHLARRYGVSRQTIYRIRKGTRRPPIIEEPEHPESPEEFL